VYSLIGPIYFNYPFRLIGLSWAEDLLSLKGLFKGLYWRIGRIRFLQGIRGSNSFLNFPQGKGWGPFGGSIKGKVVPKRFLKRVFNNFYQLNSWVNWGTLIPFSGFL